MTIYADFHFHSNHSDGRFSPSQLVGMLKKAGLFAGALTDHDTIAGLDEFFAEAAARDFVAVSGVEISCIFRDKQVHLLAYGFDVNDQNLNRVIDKLNRQRKSRLSKIIDKLNNLGLKIDLDDFFRYYEGPYWGRPDIANYLIKKGKVKSFKEAFDLYIGNGKEAYIPNVGLDIKDAINMVHNAGGIAVLAHPILYRDYFELETWTDFDLDGIEIYHPQQKNSFYKKSLKRIVKMKNWIISGGSDYHGVSPYRASGMSMEETRRLLERLKRA